MPPDEEARLRRALKDLAERIEQLVYGPVEARTRATLQEIARDARAALPPPPSPRP